MVKNEYEMRHIRSYLKKKLLEHNILLGNEKERNQIQDLIKKTVQFGESNSALLIAPPGSGKTIVSNNTLL